ncbi:MAG TPA: hypothetical protein VGV87_26460 [Blastocatellia bacterium]|jgi:hypothetical protein|nr:hypothetical protein [Blastocatellia bacterium]
MMIPILVLSLLLSGTGAGARSGADFDRLKALAGDWDATSPEGKSRITFTLISNGTAVMESMTEHNMVTVYHPDGDSVLMTHYCAVGNQPRMRARRSGTDSLIFQFVDVANLKGVGAGRMQRLVIKFQDADHLTEEWTWKEGNKETTSVFHLQRAK